MVKNFTPGSFTKNFSWRSDPKRLHRAIRSGFSGKLQPITREQWRNGAGLTSRDVELIPLNYFLYTLKGVKGDYLVVDTLVEDAILNPFDGQFLKLSLFTFHMANNGTWHGTRWSEGNLAAWANKFIREVAWKDGAWTEGAFQDAILADFIQKEIEATPNSQRKILTNYRFMLQMAGILADDKVVPFDKQNDVPWAREAIQLFWDRQIFGNSLPIGGNRKAFESSFFEHEIHKLLGIDEASGKAFVIAAYNDYQANRLAARIKQVQKIEELLATG